MVDFSIVYLTLPSINAMYLRLGKYYGKENVGLLHSRAVSSLYSLWEEDEVSPFVRQKNARISQVFS